MSKSTIRYVRRNSTPKIKHYPKARFPLGSSDVTRAGTKYHSIVQVNGYRFDSEKQRWKKEKRIVTVCHDSLRTRQEITDEAERICKATSEDFQIRNSFLVGGRRSPVDETA